MISFEQTVISYFRSYTLRLQKIVCILNELKLCRTKWTRWGKRTSQYHQFETHFDHFKVSFLVHRNETKTTTKLTNCWLSNLVVRRRIGQTLILKTWITKMCLNCKPRKRRKPKWIILSSVYKSSEKEAEKKRQNFSQKNISFPFFVYFLLEFIFLA